MHGAIRFAILSASLGLAIGCGSGDGTDDAGDGDAGAAAHCDACPDNQDIVEPVACECALTTAHMRLAKTGGVDDFYARPWPLDSRLTAEGALDLEGFPHPEGATWLTNNMQTVATRSAGFGTTAAIFMSFDAALDEGSLPADAAESLETTASIFLVDIDPRSGEMGASTPIRCRYDAEATEYNPAFFVACLPQPGFPLRPATTYGLYVTDRVTTVDGTPAKAPDTFRALRSGVSVDDELDPSLTAAYAPLLAFESSLELDGATVVGGTAFTTQDPVAPMRAIAEHVRGAQPPQLTGSLELSDEVAFNAMERSDHVVVEGHYAAPIYQQGATPYAAGGGDITFDASGAPIVATIMDLRIVVSLPTGVPMPAGGWPVAMYHHGTGGDAASFVRAGTAHDAAIAGVAMVGIDAPVHGERNPAGSDPTLLFFNISNAPAMRDNVRQGAADLLWLQQLLLALDVADADSPTGAAIRFDPERILLMGHSQGGLTGPLMLAVAEGIRGAMLSGAGGSITTSIVYKHSPIDIPILARGLLALPQGQELTLFHPALALVQTFTEPADTSNFVPYYYRWAGGSGLHVWATQGLLDEEVPPVITDTLVTSMGLQPAGLITHGVEGLALRGIDPVALPTRDNITAVDGARYTGVYTQYPDDGHFAITRNAAARSQLQHWLRTLAYEDSAELPAP